MPMSAGTTIIQQTTCSYQHDSSLHDELRVSIDMPMSAGTAISHLENLSTQQGSSQQGAPAPSGAISSSAANPSAGLSTSAQQHGSSLRDEPASALSASVPTQHDCPSQDEPGQLGPMSECPSASVPTSAPQLDCRSQNEVPSAVAMFDSPSASMPTSAPQHGDLSQDESTLMDPMPTTIADPSAAIPCIPPKCDLNAAASHTQPSTPAKQTKRQAKRAAARDGASSGTHAPGRGESRTTAARAADIGASRLLKPAAGSAAAREAESGTAKAAKHVDAKAAKMVDAKAVDDILSPPATSQASPAKAAARDAKAVLQERKRRFEEARAAREARAHDPLKHAIDKMEAQKRKKAQLRLEIEELSRNAAARQASPEQQTRHDADSLSRIRNLISNQGTDRDVSVSGDADLRGCTESTRAPGLNGLAGTPLQAALKSMQSTIRNGMSPAVAAAAAEKAQLHRQAAQATPSTPSSGFRADVAASMGDLTGDVGRPLPGLGPSKKPRSPLNDAISSMLQRQWQSGHGLAPPDWTSAGSENALQRGLQEAVCLVDQLKGCPPSAELLPRLFEACSQVDLMLQMQSPPTNQDIHRQVRSGRCSVPQCRV